MARDASRQSYDERIAPYCRTSSTRRSPEGGEEDFRELRRVGEPRALRLRTARTISRSANGLKLIDFEAGSRSVAGQKFYFSASNEAVLLELALQRFALDVAIERGLRRPTSTPGPREARSIVDGHGVQSARPRDPDLLGRRYSNLDLIGTAEITLGGLYAGEMPSSTKDDLPHASSQVSPIATAPRRARPDARARASTGCTSSPRSRCS